MRRPHQDQDPPAPEATVESEALLLTALHAVADAIVVADDAGRITMWTGGAQALFGWSADEVLGRSVELVVPPKHRDGHRQGLLRVLGGGQPHVIGRGPVMMSGLRRDGTEVPVELTLATGSQGGHRFFAAVIRDATARQHADEELQAALGELERSNAELQQFASVASHDLSEPLRIVDGYLGLLQRRYEPQLDATAREFIAYAVEAVDRMQRLIDDLLRYARAGAGEPAQEEVDLTHVVHEALATLTAMRDSTGAVVTVDELPTVTGDHVLLRQVFQNLLVNAMKFVPDGTAPRIDVRADRTEGGWEVSVADDGIGVDDEARQRIFEMFGRGRGAGPDRAGSGIGLAICKRAIEAHGGTIWVERAERDGLTGADFRFTLPDLPAPPRP
ncbi:ATP-binding protein [Paraconexibacter sp.]|uniref:sensor histidine kinase n=1 Tax=Paraconexibacter sp. TaxID=2949640 RepID=UPI003566E656